MARAIDSSTKHHDLIDVPYTLGALTAALREVEALAVNRHKCLAIPIGVTQASLADVGRKIRAYGAAAELSWLVGVLRGDVLTLGRLQFERTLTAGTRAMHIPEGRPLHPAVVDSSLGSARTYFGEDPIVCTSWLLDPSLQALPATSNIVNFAQRFEIGAFNADEEADLAVAKFVFKRPLQEILDPNKFVPSTSVQRLVIARLRAGFHWSEPRGTLR
nr:hypothetical protein [Arthrobacter gengyunqii]